MAHKSYTFEFINHPNQTLDESQKQDLIKAFKPILLEAFNQDYYNLYWPLKEKKYFEGYQILVLIKQCATIVGWVGISILKHRLMIFYVDIFALGKAHQNKGLSKVVYKNLFIKYIFGKHSRFYVCARTQNPATYKAIACLSHESYPKINQPIPVFYQDLGLRIGRELWPNQTLIKETFVIKDLWGFSLYDDAHFNKNDEVSVFINRHLNVKNGDVVFVMAYINFLSWRWWWGYAKKTFASKTL